jgi:hypothetical protein
MKASKSTQYARTLGVRPCKLDGGFNFLAAGTSKENFVEPASGEGAEPCG